MLADSINDGDTVWSQYSRSSLGNCAYPIVPSVITEPLMASSTFASWADSGVIISDTLDTCVVRVSKNGYSFQYSIDMKAGLVFAAENSMPSLATHWQLFVWGEYNGIYYLRRVCSGNGSLDTGSIENGGYDFYNIHLNGNTITHIAGNPYTRQPSPSFRVMDGKEKKKLLSDINGPVRVSVFDIRGRRLFSSFSASGIFDVNAACSPGVCPSGPLVLRIQAKDVKYQGIEIKK